MAFIFVPNPDGSFTEGDKQTNPDTGVEYIYSDGAWRALGPKIEDEFDTLDERYATQDYVDDAIAAIDALPDTDLSSYLKNEGNNDLPASTNWKIRQPTSTGSNKTLIQGRDGELGLYNLKEPNELHHAATKGYVDNATSTITRPPGLKFQYKSGSSIPPAEKFGYFTDVGEKRLMLSTTSLDFAWGTDMPRKDINYSLGPMFTIWTIQSGKWKMKTTGTLSRIDLHSDRIYCFISYATDVNGTWSTTASYYITVSGMF